MSTDPYPGTQPPAPGHKPTPPPQPCAEAPVDPDVRSINVRHIASMMVIDLAQQVANLIGPNILANDVLKDAYARAYLALTDSERVGLARPKGK